MPAPSYADRVAGLRSFFHTGATVGAKWRRARLLELRSAVLHHEKDIYRAATADLGRPVQETVCSEYANVIGVIDEVVASLETWMVPEEKSTPVFLKPGRSYVVYEPKGVVLNIASWNYPTSISLMHLIVILASGNCAVVKPPEAAPESCKVVEQICAKISDGVEVFQSPDGPSDMGQILGCHYDHIIFTGGTQIGKVILEKAAPFLTPCTLELGGKSPVVWCWNGWRELLSNNNLVEKSVVSAAGVVSRSDLARMATAMKRLIWSKMMNVGQTCTSPDYVLLVDDGKNDDDPNAAARLFASKLTDWLDFFYAAGGSFVGKADEEAGGGADLANGAVVTSNGTAVPTKTNGARGSDHVEEPPKTTRPLQRNADFGRIVNARHFDRIVGLLEKLPPQCEKIAYNDEQPNQKFIPPTFVLNPPPDSELMCEEIFGPVLPIVTVRSLEEAVVYIQSRDRKRPDLVEFGGVLVRGHHHSILDSHVT